MLTGVVARAADGAPLNSALLIGPNGAVISRYDKVNLVPFGEFVPWPFGALTRKVSTRGRRLRSRAGRSLCRPSTTTRIGAFICYESVFPSYIRHFAASGAEALFNISNDSWFGKSQARYQHLLIVRMRAAENARWILRATDNGITGVIDPAGRSCAAPQEYHGTRRPPAVPIPAGPDLLYAISATGLSLLCALIRRGSAHECRITSTSPSLTMYSLPSRRSSPFSRTPG